MFLNNTFEVFGRAGMIPDGVGINSGNGALGADSKAVGLGAVDESLGAAELEFGEALFEELPGGHAFFVAAAFCFGGGGAEEDVLLVSVEVKGLGGGLQDVGHGGTKAGPGQ